MGSESLRFKAEGKNNVWWVLQVAGSVRPLLQKELEMRIGILTGGGDAPGFNGIIESSSKALINAGCEMIGICDGFEGIFEGKTKKLNWEVINGLHAHAGTILGTSNRCGTSGREKEFLEKYKALNLDGIIAAGGDGTFSGLAAFKDDIPLIGVPKTIDNDLAGTEITFGYDTACSVVAEAVDALRTSADAHRRAIFIETMGRTAGWIALGGGLSSYADVILIPERKFSKNRLLEFIKKKRDFYKQRGLICVVSEGAAAVGEEPEVAFTVKKSPQQERFGGIAEKLARWVESEIGWESRHVVLGHLQRSKAPTTTDRFLTMAMGLKVAQLIKENDWGKAAVYKKGLVRRAPIEDLMKPPKLIERNHRWILMGRALGIFI